MDPRLRQKLESLLRPLYQDVDGASRFDEVERIGAIARRLHGRAVPPDQRQLELLILFHRLGNWLEKVGNASRILLGVPELTEDDLRRTARSIRALDAPVTEAERAVAAAALIDSAGVHGLAHRFAAARRQGDSLLDVVRAAVADSWIPEWMPETGRRWLESRIEARRRFCLEILNELSLTDSADT